MPESNTKSIAAGQRHCLNTARGLLLFSLVYVTWRFGGVDAVTRWHVGLMLLANCVLTIIGQPRFGLQSRPLPVALLVVIALSVAWPAFQLIQLPTPIYNAVATGQHEIDASLVEQTTATLAPILTDAESVSYQRRSISVVRSLSEQRVTQWIMMAAYVVLSALLFDTRKSRNVFLWTLAINTGLIATWGLIQRATGSTDLLPGVTRSNVILPFGPFIYKNAGAAAMIPGLAATIGLLWAAWLPRGGKGEKKKGRRWSSTFQYGSSLRNTDQRTIFLLGLMGLVAAGLLMSYSRGAWLAAIVATIVVLLAARQYVPKRLAAILVFVPIVVCLLIVTVTSGLKPVAERMEEQLSANYVQADARWQHWRDGLATAGKYLPVGSGIGTYGYATLAEQRSDSRLWFREAHNHYLETLTEQGLPGLVVLLVGGAMLVHYGHSLLVNGVSRHRSAIGLVGLASIIAIAVQSTFDFVVLIPAVMFLFASLFGLVAQTYVSPSGRRMRVGKVKPEQVLIWSTRPAVCLTMVCLTMLFAQYSAIQQIDVNRVISATQPYAATVPNEFSIMANLDRLNESIVKHPERWELYQRRADWNTVKLRTSLRRASMRAGNEMDWEGTKPSILFQKMMTLPPVERALVIDEMAIDPQMREPLRAVLADLKTLIRLNPFVPASHLAAALLSPAVAVSPKRANENLSRLALSNPRLQFMSGLIYHFLGDHEQMIDRWQRSLRGTTPELDQMVQLCMKTMTLKEVTTQLIPPDRSVLLLPMIRALDDDQRARLRDDVQTQQLIDQRVLSDNSLAAAKRHALIAWIATDLEQTDRAANHWGNAVGNDRENSDYRYQFCRTLLKQGDYQEVFKQCSLGQSLEPDRDRFHHLLEAARKKMKSKGR